ncbi:hypothetical protein AB0H12_25880 [Actinosynnema sp. NPDC023794]
MEVTDRAEYDAFISYSHARDGRSGPALRTGLQRLAKPWYRLRAMRVFLDNASLSADPDLWGSIERALASSRWLVLMASVRAARSVWVAREVEWWLANRSADRILLVLTDGELDPDHESTALPPPLRTAMATEPRWVDLRWLRDTEHVDQTDARFRDCVADIAATVRGVPKDDLVGEDIRRHRTTLRLARGAVVALALLAVLAVVGAVLAVVQRDNARAEARIATARGLASAALANVDTRLDLAHLLAVEAYRTDPQPVTRSVLFQVLTASPHLERYLHVGSRVTSVAASRDGRVAVAGTAAGRVVRWDLVDGARTEIGLDRPVVDLSVDADGDAVAVLVEGRAVRWDGRDAVTEVGVPADHNRGSAAISPSGEVVAFLSHRLEPGDARDDEGRLVVHDRRTGRSAESTTSNWPEKVALRSEDELAVLASTEWQLRSVDDLAVRRSVPVSVLPADGGHAVGYSPDGGHFAWSRDGETWQWRTEGVATADYGTADVRLPIGEPDPESLAISPDGDRIAVGHTGVLHVLDTSGQDQGRRWRLPGNDSRADALAFVGDSDHLVSGTDDALVLWDLTRNTRVGEPLHGDVPTTCRACRAPRLVTAPDRIALVAQRHVLVGADDGVFAGFEAGRVDDYDAAPVWSADGARLLVLSTPSGTVDVYDRDGAEMLDQWPAVPGLEDLMAGRASADGARLVLVDQDGRVHVLDSSTGEVLDVIETGVDTSLLNRPVQADRASVSADGGQVAVSGAAGVVLVDVAAGTTRELPGGPADSVHHTEARLLVERATAVEVWDRDGATVTRSVPSTGRWVPGLAATQDGRVAARVRADHVLVLTDLGSGEPLGTIPLPHPSQGVSRLTAVAPGTDASHLLTAEPDGELTRWHLAEQEWVRAACASAGRDLSADEWRRYVGTQPPDSLACLR